MAVAAQQGDGDDRPGHGDFEILDLDEARTRLDDAHAARADAEARLADLQAERIELDEARIGLVDDEVLLLRRMEEAKAQARHLAVEAYVRSGDLSGVSFVFDVENAADSTWRSHLVSDHAETTTEAAERYLELREEADENLVILADRLDRNASLVEQAERDLEATAGLIEVAEVELVIADAWHQAEEAMASGPYGSASPAAWEQLVWCESRGDYRAVSPSGAYRGAYQFDLPTWWSVGGQGDPVDAPPAEQDARARLLYARRGSQPWPVCGAHLP
jgi:hypothetical protein